MKTHKISILFFALISSLSVHGQTTQQEMFDEIEKTGGVYYVYQAPEKGSLTAAPKGYSPFYISHYSRHGSRYLISDKDYKWVIDLFAKAHEQQALTPLGEDVNTRLMKIWPEAEGRGGDLTPLGRRQHQGIAQRMYQNYPEVFTDGRKISARSTVVLRCAMSMAAFGDQL